MWVKLIQLVTIHPGTSVSVGPLEAQKLIADGRAVQTVFPGSGDSGNIEETGPLTNGDWALKYKHRL